MLLWMSSGVEVVAVGVRKLDVQAGAAFEFADSGGCGAEVLGDLGEGESSLVAQGSEVVGVTCFSSNVAFSVFDQSTPCGFGRWL